MSLQHILFNKIPHKPIHLNTEMVQATQEGRKTQTRRIVEGQFPVKDEHDVYATLTHNGQMAHFTAKGQGESFMGRVNPYGAIGHLLYVREKWRVIGWSNEGDGFDIQYADMSIQKEVQLFDDYDEETEFIEKLCSQMSKRCEPAINEEEETFSWTYEQILEHMPWKPSIHMPKAAARIWLRIKDIRVERIQGISEEGAIAEGMRRIKSPVHKSLLIYHNYAYKKNGEGLLGHGYLSLAKFSFETLWYSLYGQDSWEKNPWVWAIEFEVLSSTGAPSLELINAKTLSQV